ncbi:hypothetical protein ACXWYY_003411 [Enterobacter hormaechei]
MLNMKKHYLVTVCVVVFAAGCNQKTKTYSAVKPQEVKTSTTDIRECERELTALREVDNQKFLELEKEFERMMSGSANYASVRNTINVNTQDTIDSLYHYQAAKVCNDIRVAMLAGLIDKSGATK